MYKSLHIVGFVNRIEQAMRLFHILRDAASQKPQ